MNQHVRETLTRNLLWFAASLLLAVVVWFVAISEANPVTERRFGQVAVQLLTDNNMVVTNNPRSTVQVFVRAQKSVLDLLEQEDVIVTADTTGLDAGTHTLPLEVQIARQARADTQPAQITVTLEQLVTQQKPVQINLIAPSLNFATENLQQTVPQAVVSGTQERVASVETARADLDLSDQRTEEFVERTIQLVPVDEEGNRIEGVTVEPRNVTVSVDVVQRDDVRTVNVRPFILFNTLPESFEFDTLNDWEPNEVLISGSPEDLEKLGETVDTEPISLAGRTGDFVVEVPLDLPNGDYIVLSGNGTITVDIAISEQATTISLENVPVNLIGIMESQPVQATPEQISVVLNGPESLLSGLTAADVQAVVDVNGLVPGTIDVIPQISIRQGQVNLDTVNVTLIPGRVSVTLLSPTPEGTTVQPPSLTVTPSDP